MKRAKIIVIEGTDGSGKEKQSNKLYEYYANKGYKVFKTSFPVYSSPSGKLVGGPFQGKEDICEKSYFTEGATHVDPYVSCLYYAADRRYNFLNSIEDELYKNDIVILDRYTTSNMGHQGSKAKNNTNREKVIKFIEKLEFELLELPKPDIVVFLNMPTNASIELRKNRVALDDPERDIKHLMKSEKNYIEIAKKKKWFFINCIKTNKYKKLEDIKTIDDIHKEIVEKINSVINAKNSKINKMTRF